MTSSPATSPPARPTWDDTWMAAARVMKDRSLCVRDKVGAVVAGLNQQVLASGYNGPPRGFEHNERPCSDWCRRAQIGADLADGVLDAQPSPVYHDCPSLHAEANAIATASVADRRGATIYVTSHVCMSCAKLIANSGITRVYVRATRPDAHRRPDEVYRFLRGCGLSVDATSPGSRW